MDKLTDLTPKQESQLDVYRDKWLAIGLSTEPCNRKEAIKYAKMAYKVAKITPPKTENFFFTRSPMECAKLLAEKGVSEDALKTQAFGCHDASWLGFYEYFKDECGIKEAKPLEGLMGIAKNCGWWAPFTEFCVLQDRPTEIHMDDRGRLHKEDGPSILYGDGFCVWSLQGQRVSEKIVMRPETLTVKEIEDEGNAEVKRIMIELFGTSRYLKESGATLVDADYEGARTGAAPRCLLKGKGGQKWMYGTDGSTSRGYYIPVPDEVETCEEAHNSIAGFSEDKIISKS